MEAPVPARKRIAPAPWLIFLLGLVVQSSCLQPLWNHSSTSAEFLGRYSLRYGAALVLSLILTAGWVAVAVFHRQAARLLRRLPGRLVLGLVIGSGVALILLWQFSFESQILYYVSLNWLLVVAALALVRTDLEIGFERWPHVLLVMAVVLLIPLGITAATRHRFSPDEAHWADMATTFFLEGGVYSRTWYYPQMLIQPGLPWSVVGYGWMLEHIDFALYVGRLWNFGAYLLAFVGIGLVTAHLYGRREALLSVSMAILLWMIIPVYDYRPDHQLVALGPLLFWIMLKGRAASTPLRGMGWHAAAGLLATLSLNLHAAGIVFAVGSALFYLGDYLSGGWRKGRTGLLRLAGFGLGALIGTGCYYLTNIHVIGGLDVYFDALVSQRWSAQRRLLRILEIPPIERLVVLAGIAYLLWRRAAADRVYLGVLASLVVSAALVDTQGYRSPFAGLLIIPVGTLLLDGFGSEQASRGTNLRSVMIGGAVFAALLAQMTGGFIQWGSVARWVTTGTAPPTFYEELRPVLTPYVSDEDVVLGITALIWTFPDHPALVNYGAETTGQERLGVDDPLAVWEIIQPTVVIHVEREMSVTPAMQAYMDQGGFVRCLDTPVQGQAIRVYRQECPRAAG